MSLNKVHTVPYFRIVSHISSLSFDLVPPEWISKPSDQEAVEGEDVFFPCSVSGVPEPMITWRKLAGKDIYFNILCIHACNSVFVIELS
jgi:hypothetical protein